MITVNRRRFHLNLGLATALSLSDLEAREIAVNRRRFQSNLELATALSLSDLEAREHLQEEEVVQLSMAMSQSSDSDSLDFDVNDEGLQEDIRQLVSLVNTTLDDSMTASDEDEYLYPPSPTNEDEYLYPPTPDQDEAVTRGHGEEKLPAKYENYRDVPTMFSEDHMWPQAAIYKQRMDLSINRGNEDIVEWKENQTELQRCLVCLTNIATRVAVPCGHRLCCRDCISSLVNESVYYKVTTSDGDIITTDRRLPVQCSTCRAIIGLIVVVR